MSWQDFDWQEHLITWPGELHKEGNRHTSAMTPDFIRMVKARARRQGLTLQTRLRRGYIPRPAASQDQGSGPEGPRHV